MVELLGYRCPCYERGMGWEPECLAEAAAKGHVAIVRRLLQGPEVVGREMGLVLAVARDRTQVGSCRDVGMMPDASSGRSPGLCVWCRWWRCCWRPALTTWSTGGGI